MTIIPPVAVDVSDSRARYFALREASDYARWGGPKLVHTDRVSVAPEAIDALRNAYSENRIIPLAIALNWFVVVPSDGVIKIEATRKKTLIHKDPSIKPRSFQMTEELIEVYRPKRVAYGTLSDLANNEWNTVFGFKNLKKYLEAYGQFPNGECDPKRWYFTAFSAE